MDKLRNNYWIAFVFFLLAMIPRLIRLDYQSLWYEELMTLKFSSGESFMIFLKSYIAHPDFHPPLYPVLIYALKSLGVVSEWGLKLPSVIFGAGCASFTYLLGEKLYDKRTGILAALMMTLSGASVYYSQEIRYSSCLIFFTLLLTWISFNDYKYKTALLSIVGLVLSYLHYTAFLFSIANLLFFAFKDFGSKKNQPYLLSALIVMLGFLPWLQIMLVQSESWSIYREYNQYPSWFVYFYKMLDFSFVYQTYWQGVPQLIEINTLKIIFYIFLIEVTLYRAYIAIKEKTYAFDSKNLYLYGIVIGSISVFFVHDLFSQKKYFYEKALLYTVPYIYLVFSSLMVACLKKTSELIIMSLVIFSLFIFQPFINQKYYSTIFKTEFKQMTNFVLKISPLAPIIVACGDPAWYQYYLKKGKAEVIYSSEERILKDIDNIKSDRFWIISAHCQDHSEFSWSNQLTVEKHYQSSTQASAFLVRKK